MDVQHLLKLSDKVCQYSKKNGIIDNFQTNCEHLQELIEQLHNGKFGDKVVLMLIKLVNNKVLSSNYLITECVSLAALGKPLKNIVLLFIHLIANSQETISTSSKHPLSRLYQNQPSSLRLIFSTFKEFLYFQLQEKSPRNVTSDFKNILLPFFDHIINDGQVVSELVSEVLHILTTTILFNHANVITVIIQHMLGAFKNYALLKKGSCELIPALNSLAVWLLTKSEEMFTNVNGCVGFDLIWLLLSCSWNQYQQENYDELFQPMFLVKCLIKRCVVEKNYVKKNCANQPFDELLFACSMMLLNVHYATRYEVLQIVHHLLLSQLCDPVDKTITHLYLPLFAILSERLIYGELEKRIHILSKRIVQLITDEAFANSNIKSQRLCVKDLHQVEYSEIITNAHVSLSMLQSFMSDASLILPWLQDIIISCQKNEMLVNDHVTLMLTSLLLSNEEDIYDPLMNCIIHVVKAKPDLVSRFLPVILYVLNQRKYKVNKLIIMHALPKLAVTKETVPTILKLILTFSTNNELLSLALQMITDLWKLQPRIYPYVHQLLTKELDKASTPNILWYDWVLSRVTSIWRICKQNSNQHGQEMVILLSNILEKLINNTSMEDHIFEKQTCICLSLLVESLKEICIELVIDIESIWKAVIIKLLSGFSQSAVVLQSICSLLSAVPVCVKENNEIFIDEVLQYLWHLTQHKSPEIQSSSYSSLSKFPPEKMKVKYLPQKVQVIVCEQLLKQIKEDDSYEPLEETCPGFAYLILLHEIPTEAHAGYQMLLNNVLQNEVENLPSSVGRRMHMKQLDTSLHEIPSFLKHQYDTNARPAVLPGLTAGLLCCYQPTVHGIDHDNPSNKHLIQLKVRYCQMLENLLHDFTIQLNDWHHIMFASKSWCHFMKNMLSVCIEGRKAELEVQKEKLLITDEERYEEDMASIKYYVRDNVTDILRKASKGNPKIQGNSILALVGLATALTSYEECEEVKLAVADQYISLRHWLIKVADTVMVIFDGNYKSKCKPFQWCQQVSSSKSSASSFLSRCAAVISFNELVHPLLPIDSERILHMVEMTKERIPGQSKAATSTPMHLYFGIGYGLLVSKLYREQFQNVVGDSQKMLLSSCVEIMRKIVFDQQSNQIQDGVILSFGVTLANMLAFDAKKDSQVFAVNAQRKLFDLVKGFTADDFTNVCVSGYMISFACITSQAFLTKCISSDEFHLCYDMLQEKLTNEFTDTYIAIGILNSTVLRGQILPLMELVNSQLSCWKDILTNKSSEPVAKLCAVKGITSSYGIEMSLYGNIETKQLQFSSYTKALTKSIGAISDDTISNITAKLTGCMYMSSDNSLNGSLIVPSNYDYLKENLLLRAIFSSLSEASTTGPHGLWSNGKVSVVLHALECLTSITMPPVNWILVLSPLFQVGYSNVVQTSCLKFSLKYAATSVNIALWVSSWLQPTSFLKLSKEHQFLILKNTALLLPSLPNAKQKSLLEEIPVLLLNESKDFQENVSCIFEAWLSVVLMQEPPQSTVAYTMSGIKAFIEHVNKYSVNKIRGVISVFAQCVYVILKENWETVAEKLALRSVEVHKCFQIEMLLYVKPLKLDQIICVIDQLNENDLPRLFAVLFTKCDVSANLISSLLDYLCNRYTFTKTFTAVELKLFYRCISALSISHFTVKPSESFSTSNSFNLIANGERLLVKYLINEKSNAKKVLAMIRCK